MDENDPLLFKLLKEAAVASAQLEIRPTSKDVEERYEKINKRISTAEDRIDMERRADRRETDIAVENARVELKQFTESAVTSLRVELLTKISSVKAKQSYNEPPTKVETPHLDARTIAQIVAGIIALLIFSFTGIAPGSLG